MCKWFSKCTLRIHSQWFLICFLKCTWVVGFDAKPSFSGKKCTHLDFQLNVLKARSTYLHIGQFLDDIVKSGNTIHNM